MNQTLETTEQQNIAHVQRMFEAFSRGDIGYIVDQLDENVEWIGYFDPIVPWNGSFNGKTNVPNFFRLIGENVDVVSFTPEEYIGSGDTVVTRGEFTSTAKSTGKTAAARWIMVFRFANGRVTGYEQFGDPKAAQDMFGS